jgi:hypothetical protein
MPLQTRQLASDGTAVCTLCGSTNQAWVFRTGLESAPLAHSEAALEGEATCFDHPDNRASATCARCGRYVCDFCAVNTGAEVLCPSCVASGRVAAARPDAQLTLYDSIALTLPLATLIIYPFTIPAAPASLVISLLKWKKPISPVRRNRWRFVAAILISLTEIALWTLGLIYLIPRIGNSGGGR